MTPPLCSPCRAARLRWLDSKPSTVIPGLYAGPPAGRGPGLAADGKTIRAWSSTPADTWRYEAWRDVVRFQRQLIADICRAASHVAEAPAARIVQLDLFAQFDQLEGAA